METITKYIYLIFSVWLKERHVPRNNYENQPKCLIVQLVPDNDVHGGLPGVPQR